MPLKSGKSFLSVYILFRVRLFHFKIFSLQSERSKTFLVCMGFAFFRPKKLIKLFASFTYFRFDLCRFEAKQNATADYEKKLASFAYFLIDIDVSLQSFTKSVVFCILHSLRPGSSVAIGRIPLAAAH